MNNLKCVCPKCSFKYEIPLKRDLPRTLPANRAYWGVYLKIIADEIGELCPEDLHEELKIILNPKDSKLNWGDKYGGSTAIMTRKQFSEYLEKVRIWAETFHGIILPEIEKPKENHDKNNKSKSAL